MSDHIVQSITIGARLNTKYNNYITKNTDPVIPINILETFMTKYMLFIYTFDGYVSRTAPIKQVIFVSLSRAIKFIMCNNINCKIYFKHPLITVLDKHSYLFVTKKLRIIIDIKII